MLTMTDCSDPDNRVQARYELDRAIADSGYAKLSAWAMKWARPLLDYADAAPTEDEVANDVGDVVNAWGADVDAKRARISEKISDIRDALDELENI